MSNSRTYQSNIASQMEGNKYKLLMRISLADLEIVKGKCVGYNTYNYIYDSLYLC